MANRTRKTEEALHVGNFRAKRVRRIALNALTNSANGYGTVTEIYFRTATGNLYRISRLERETGSRLGPFVLTDVRLLKEYELTNEEIATGVLREGEPFFYGENQLATEITEIICVDTTREYPLLYFCSNGIRRYRIRDEFDELAAGI